MAIYQCGLCSTLYDESKESVPWDQLPDDWVCPVCGSPKSEFSPVESAAATAGTTKETPPAGQQEYLGSWARPADDFEVYQRRPTRQNAP